LHAALELLREVGYRSVTVEAIAARAGVGKQTIYRWWPSRAAVVLEAYVAEASVSVPYPDTGSLKSDLLKYLTDSFASLQGKQGQTLRGLAAEAQLDAEFEQEFLDSFILTRRAGFTEILTRAIERGELPDDIDSEVLTDMIYGAKWFRLLFRHAPLDEGLALRVVHIIERLSPQGPEKEAAHPASKEMKT
jgi:AcrR family transcriptional regulator